MKTWVFLLATAQLATVGIAPAQDKGPWIGKRVFTKYGTVLKVGDQVVDDEGRSNNLTISGHDRNICRVYRIEHVDGEWLWLKAEESGAAGWSKFKDVIPYVQAIDYYTKLIGSDPQASYYSLRGNIWVEKGEYDIAIADFNEAIRLEPSDAIHWANRGRAWAKKEFFEKTILDCNEAIRLDPKHAMAYNYRGHAWEIKRDYDKAIDDYTKSIRLDPKYSLTYTHRGMVWFAKKDYNLALADLSEAIRLDPDDAGNHGRIAWFWATCPAEKYRDGRKATSSATKACELALWKDASMLGTLAAAYAEQGNFEKAVEWQEKANNLNTDADDKQKGEDRLQLYKDKKAYREEG
jgi:tetratricopeptide (TPR) repeat protein